MDNQLSIPIGPMPVKELTLIDAIIIQKVPSMKEAIRLCINVSGYSQKFVAEYLDIDQGHMSKIMSGQGHFPEDKLLDLMSLCANYAPLQYLALNTGFELSRPDLRLQRIEKLEQELKELKESSYG